MVVVMVAGFRIVGRELVDDFFLFFRWLIDGCFFFFFGSGWLVVCGVERGAHATTHERQGRGGFQGRDRWCYD